MDQYLELVEQIRLEKPLTVYYLYFMNIIFLTLQIQIDAYLIITINIMKA